MDPVTTCDRILSYLKQSNLNFYLSESPFSASVVIRKTFIKENNGSFRTSGLPSTSTQLLKEEKNAIEADKDALINENESLQIQLVSSQNEIAQLKVDIEQLQIGQKILDENKDDLKKALDVKSSDIASLKQSVTELEKVNNATKHELDQIKKTVKNIRERNNQDRKSFI